ncbi:PHP domain-containing protein [Humidisolicoccus flavus]|uniref:PHP domain-containing protein n=1 Tax=Humidisolicoccus flavus TaxID=3111414 RepID=UPI00324B4756
MHSIDWMSLPGPIDLHAHSRESDGTESPRGLVTHAIEAGLGAVAITDHDTLSGWAEASDAARELGIVLIPGIEFSAQIHYASVHVLGYLPDPEAPSLLQERIRIRADRVQRAESMVQRISADYPLTWEHVLESAADGATIGRPHIADALVTLGVVANRSAAFETILHWQGGYYVPHVAPSPTSAIRIIREAGGVPVIAHPGARGAQTMRRSVLKELVDAGLSGLEIEHRDNPPEAREWLRRRADEFGLFVTGSSDWHGAGKPNQMGEHSTAPEVLAQIVEQASGSEPVIPAPR